MNEFIAANPAIAKWLLGILCGMIGYLGYILFFFLKRSFDNLTNAITSLEGALAKDRQDIGALKDRMVKQETTCGMQRTLCPNTNGQKINMGHLITNPELSSSQGG